jgi:hypothetical protein
VSHALYSSSREKKKPRLARRRATGVNTALENDSLGGNSNPHQKNIDAALVDTEGRRAGREQFLTGPDEGCAQEHRNPRGLTLTCAQRSNSAGRGSSSCCALILPHVLRVPRRVHQRATSLYRFSARPRTAVAAVVGEEVPSPRRTCEPQTSSTSPRTQSGGGACTPVGRRMPSKPRRVNMTLAPSLGGRSEGSGTA